MRYKNIILLTSYDEVVALLGSTSFEKKLKSKNTLIIVLAIQSIFQFLEKILDENESLIFELRFLPGLFIEKRKNIINKFLAERNYLKKLTHKIQDIDFSKIKKIIIFARLCNGTTLYLAKFLKENSVSEIIFQGSIPSKKIEKISKRVFFEYLLKFLKYRIIYGKYSEVVNLGYRIVFQISNKFFDREIAYEKPHIRRIYKIKIRNKNPIVFLTQPLVKMKRIRSEEYDNFIEKLNIILKSYKWKVLIKVHPRDDDVLYQNMNHVKLDKLIPFQFFEFEHAPILLTFSSTSVFEIDTKKIISLVKLVKYSSTKYQTNLINNIIMNMVYTPYLPEDFNQLKETIKKLNNQKI